MAFQQYLERMSKTEIISILAERELSILPSIEKSRLVELMLGDIPENKELSPTRFLSSEIRIKLDEHWQSLQLQLIETCKGRCRKEERYKCPDILTVICHSRMAAMKIPKRKTSRSLKKYRSPSYKKPV